MYHPVPGTDRDPARACEDDCVLFCSTLLLVQVLSITTPCQSQSAGGAKATILPEFQRLGMTPGVQGGRPNCSLFAITALANYEWLQNQPIPAIRFSEEFLLWAARQFSQSKDEGAMFYEAILGLSKYGICRTELMPYAPKLDPSASPSEEAMKDAAGRSRRWKIHWIRRWDVTQPMTDAELAGIKQTIQSGHPVACGLRWPKKGSAERLMDPPSPDEVMDGHSIVFVAYEDDPSLPGGGAFQFRNSRGPAWGEKGYGLMSYAYARAYANDAVWMELTPPNSERPDEVFQAERLEAEQKEMCELSTQDMRQWNGKMWSGGRQLFCRSRNGGHVKLAFAVQTPGTYRVRLGLTTGPDYGIVRVSLDDGPASEPCDLYSGKVSPAGFLELGTHELKAGKHTIRIRVEGKHTASSGTSFGIDTLELLCRPG